jgi:hypothetical protein
LGVAFSVLKIALGAAATVSIIVGICLLVVAGSVGDYLDENGSVISDPRKNLDKLVDRESLLKTDIELLIERNKIYWGGDLDF